ncbi:7-cyano-7-deazaguanine synthase [Paenibacillus hubeiensis]|uniref:7-cyano-7-deazaguanine synthase n=1 Tax=Paenibacillus hubeiensis TaxID=3077330 RepID=UPI0031B9E287
MKEKVIVLLSGGPDSSSLTYWLNAQGYAPIGIYMNQGKPYSFNEVQSVNKIAEDLNMLVETIDISSMISLFNGKVPTCGANPGGYIRFGTSIVLSIAVAYALEHNVNKCFIAIHADDKILGPEFTREFFKSMEESIEIAQKNSQESNVFQLHTPFLEKSKSDVLIIGRDLEVPFQETWSCIESTNDKHCGECKSCLARQKAFNQAGIPDPTIYQNENV